MKATNVFFGIGIAAALFFLVLSGISTFFPEPIYEDFCEDVPVNSTGQCDNGAYPKFNIETRDASTCEICDSDAHQEALSEHKKTSFLIKSILAIIIMFVSAYFIRSMPSIGNGVLVAGISTLISGYADSFSYGVKGVGPLRFFVGLIATAVLIFLAVRFYIKREDKKK